MASSLTRSTAAPPYGPMRTDERQGMLVHMGQWFGLWNIVALHPVNALVLAYTSLTLARHASTLWAAQTDVTPAPAGGSAALASG